MRINIDSRSDHRHITFMILPDNSVVCMEDFLFIKPRKSSLRLAVVSLLIRLMMVDSMALVLANWPIAFNQRSVLLFTLRSQDQIHPFPVGRKACVLSEKLQQSSSNGSATTSYALFNISALIFSTHGARLVLNFQTSALSSSMATS